MNAIVDRKQFLMIATEVERFVPVKAGRRILSCMLISANNENVRVAGTDLQITAQGSVQSQTTKEGSAVVPARQLLRTLQVLKDEFITFVRDEDSRDLHIKGIKSDITLPGEPPDEFPTIITPTENTYIIIPAQDWHEMMRRVMFAASASQTRYALNGGFLQWDTKHRRLRLVATDGKRLAIITRKAEARGKQPELIKIGMIIPSAFFNKTQQLTKKAEYVLLSQHAPQDSPDKFLTAAFGCISVTSRMIEGHFPDYEGVVPECFETILIVGNKVFDQALQEAMLAIESNEPCVKLSLNSVCMIISAHNSDGNKAEVTLLPEIKGPELDIGINPYYLLDFLHQFEDGNVTLQFKNAEGAILVTHEIDGEYRYVLMPHKL